MVLSKFNKLEKGDGIIGYLRSSSREGVFTPSKLQIGILTILIFTCIALSLKNYDQFQIGVWMDDAHYAVLAKSIIFSDTYGIINGPGHPLPTRYPFGFPLLLSPIVWLFPTTPELLNLISLLATLLNIFLIFWGWSFLSQNHSYWWGLVIAALYAISPLVIGQTRMVMSEPVFTTFLLVSLILTERYLVSSKENLLPTLISGIVIFFALFIRTIGIVLVAAVFARILLMPLTRQLKIRRIFYLIVGGITFISIIIIVTPVKIDHLLPIKYYDQFQNPHAWGWTHIEEDLVPRIFGAFLEYTTHHLRDAVIPIGGGSSEIEFGLRFGISNLPQFSGLIIGCLILLGSLSVFQKQGLQPSVFIFEVLYFGACLLWSFRASRFLYPILPFLFFHLILGVRIAANQLRRVKIIPQDINHYVVNLSMIFIFLIIFLISIYKGISDNSDSTQFVPDLKVGASWLKENSSSEALIMAQQPQAIYVYSERHTIDYPYDNQFYSPDQFLGILHKNKVDYIILAPEMNWRYDGLLDYDEVTSRKVIPILNELAQRGTIDEVYQSEKDLVIVYSVRHP
jgi:hypothetical protein